MWYAWSALRTCSALRSTSENTATDSMPISRQARMMRTAISPRLAIRIRLNMRAPSARLQFDATQGHPALRDGCRAKTSIVMHGIPPASDAVTVPSDGAESPSYSDGSIARLRDGDGRQKLGCEDKRPPNCGGRSIHFHFVRAVAITSQATPSSPGLK